jgi:hypothetical protein
MRLDCFVARSRVTANPKTLCLRGGVCSGADDGELQFCRLLDCLAGNCDPAAYRLAVVLVAVQRL